jgi:hypothetical protein
LRIFEQELFRQKEILVASDEEMYKLKTFEEFIYKFHIEIIKGFYVKTFGHEGPLPHIDIIVQNIIERFWSPEIYIHDWQMFNNLANNIGWYTDRIGNRAITTDNYIYPEHMTNNYTLDRITMANLLMNELIMNDQDVTTFINFVNVINNIINIPEPEPETEENTEYDEMPLLTPIYSEEAALAQALTQTQGQIHFINDNERKFNINLVLQASILADTDTNNNNNTDANEAECQICYNTKTKCRFVKLNCQHEYCAPCIIQTMNNTNQYKEPCCPFCRSIMTEFIVSSEEDFQILEERIV